MGLMEAVFHHSRQNLPATRHYRRQCAGRPADVEDCIIKADFGRQYFPGLPGANLEAGNDYADIQLARRIQPDAANIFCRHTACSQAAEKCGGDVVGVTFDLSGDFQKLLAVQVSLQQLIGGDQPADNCRAAAAQSAGQGNVVVLAQVPSGRLPAGLLR